MNLLEFISYCTLKGYVQEHKELPKPDWDTDAEKYFGLELQGRGYNATITYATIGEGAAVVNCGLYDHLGYSNRPPGQSRGKVVICPSLRDITEAFIPA